MIILSRLYKVALLLFLVSSLNAQPTRVMREFFLDNDGHKLHMTVRLPAKAGARLSTVVFENGLGVGAETWSGVIDKLPGRLRIVTYDRPGMGKSESDGASPTPEHVASVLHAALSRVASRPYILVGHSWGGPLIRAFAGLYPSEVAGLVFIDPTDFTETASGRAQYLFGPLGHAGDGEKLRSTIEDYFYRKGAELPPATRSELDVSHEARLNDFSSFSRLPMPPVPLVVLLSTQWFKDLPADLKVPFDAAKYEDLLLNYRILSLSAFSRSVPDGTLLTTARSGHFIQVDEPAFVCWAIGRVLYPPVKKS
ncbi:MAG TPA: alpha/beta hydrolase [Candidatus Saccharimonadales bacterium]|nr:alpha/beta hydrolase [Candidatus Saccharimonadales bacterium]